MGSVGVSREELRNNAHSPIASSDRHGPKNLRDPTLCLTTFEQQGLVRTVAVPGQFQHQIMSPELPARGRPCRGAHAAIAVRSAISGGKLGAATARIE